MLDIYQLNGVTLTVPEYIQAQKDIELFRAKRRDFMKDFEPSMLNCCECYSC